MEKSGVPWDPYPEVVLLHKQIKDQHFLYVQCGSHFTEYFQNLVFLFELIFLCFIFLFHFEGPRELPRSLSAQGVSDRISGVRDSKKVNPASGKTLLEYFPLLAMVRCN